MRAGLDVAYVTAADLPTAEQLFIELLPTATAIARRYRLDDPEGAATDAVTEIVVERRYQERWNPLGSGTLTSYLYGMMSNRLLDHRRRQTRRAARERLGIELAPVGDREATDERLLAVEDDRYDDVDTLASLDALRDLVAMSTYQGEVPLLDLFDALVGQALAGERPSMRALGREFSTSRHAVGRAREVIAQALADFDG